MADWLNVTRVADAVLRTTAGASVRAGLGIARMLRLPAEISLELMSSCLGQVISENESLRVRFRNHDGIWQQQVVEDDGTAVLFDLANPSAGQNPGLSSILDAWINWCQEQSFDLTAGKLLISSALEDEQGATWCYLSLHPAIADSYTVDALWGRLAVLLRQKLAHQHSVYLPRLTIAELLEAQRRTAGTCFAHTEFWLANPPANPRNPESAEKILSQPDTAIAPGLDKSPGIPFTQQMTLSAEIKDVLLEAAKRHGGTWEQAQLASIAAFLGRKAHAARLNIGYSFSNLLLFGDSAAWSDAASQLICRSEVTLPLSVPVAGQGLEQMKQVKVQIDRIEDHSLVSPLDLEPAAEANQARLYGAMVDVREVDTELVLGERAVQLTRLSDGPVSDLRITVCGLSEGTADIEYRIYANPHRYGSEELIDLLAELMTWQYHWAHAVLKKEPVENIQAAE